MAFSSHSLHHAVVSLPKDKVAVAQALKAISAERLWPRKAPQVLPAPAIEIALSTVSMAKSFDAWMDVQPKGGPASQLLVDSGNSVLIMPYWEHFAALPNCAVDYQILGQANEPWGCPANVVRGPIEMPTSEGGVYTLPNCVFYACTDAAIPGGDRTANFGAACLNPWTASGWNTPGALGVVLKAPLAYGDHSIAEFDYAPANLIFRPEDAPHVEASSSLVLHQVVPPGYSTFPVIQDLMWMALSPISLAIGGVATGWPGEATNPIAVIDTGGTAAFLSDPNGYVYDKPWPDPVQNPDWTRNSISCQSTSDDIELQIGTSGRSYKYMIDTSKLPPSVRGLTLVMCQTNSFMMGEQGLNTGGVSALFNSILVDYVGAQVGFSPRVAI